MTQLTFFDVEYLGKRRRSRPELFLPQMEQVIPWRALLDLIEPHYPKAGPGRHPYALETVLRIYLLQQWYNLSDPAMEEALYEITSLRQFAQLSLDRPIPDETTVLHFRHLLEKHALCPRLLEAVNQHLQAPIGVDAESGLVHSIKGTSANESDIAQAAELLHGKERHVFADAGYQGVSKRAEVQQKHRDARWHVAMRPGKRRALDKQTDAGTRMERMEQLKARIRAKVEHPFPVIKRQFGYMQVRYRGLAKNTAQLHTLFSLSNLWMARKHVLPQTGEVRPLAG